MSGASSKREGRRRHKREVNRRWPLVLVFVLAAALITVGGTAIYRAQRTVARAEAPEEIEIARQLMRQSIRAEFKTSFSPADETSVEKLPEHKVRVSGWVDLVTRAGASSRQNYSIVISRDGTGDWVGDQLSVMPRM